MFKLKDFISSRIITRLLLWFLLLALLPFSLVSYLSYSASEKSLREEVRNNLLALTDSKGKQIETYVSERQQDVTLLARTPDVIEAIEEFDTAFQKGGLDSPEYALVDDKLRPFFTDYVTTAGYSDLFLISASGDAVFSVKKGESLGSNYYTGDYKESELARVFDNAQTLLLTEISDFEYYSPTSKPAAFIAAPIFKEGIIIGVVALQMSNEEIYAVVNDYTGLGETGETIIGSRDGDRILFITPLRHDTSAAFKRSASIGSKEALPLQEAAQGTKGDGLAIDYRGQETIAAWKYLPSLRWGMVVKIDAAEALAPIIKQRNSAIILAGLSLLAVVGVALLVSRTIAAPITALTEVVKLMTGGDLNRKAPADSKDEIGELGRAFNKMSGRLRHLIDTLEDNVRERTRVLETSAEISRQITAIIELDELLLYAAQRIRDGFGLYYAHIYLIEEGTDALVMMAGSGEVGRLLKARGHRLKSGEGIVGAVASLNKHFMSNNVYESINWVPNDLLPDTQSELALPLRKGERVLGVLDLQSDQLNYFSDEDATTLQSLANQIAAAVDNARLLAETQTALQEIGRLNRRLTREAWKDFEQSLITTGYRFVGEESAAVQPASDLWLPQMRQAVAAKQSVRQLQPGNGEKARSELAVPLLLRGEVIGALGIKREGTSEWTSEEEAIVGAVADQVARALENARLSEEQARTIDQLQEVDRLKTGFLTSMSHELRTPLNSIIGFADILLQGIDGPLTDNAVTDITAIHGSGKHLLALINDILDLSKIEAGRMELVRNAVSVPIIFKEVAASVSSLLKERPVRLIQKADYELPKIWADPLRFSQIIINLVSNAVKFTEEGRVVIGAELFNPTEMHIYVQDTGIGIPEDKIDLVFESFRQVDARNNRKYQGTGMGLAISKQLVEMHGGQIWVESVLGEGTTFHFTIGLAQR